MRIFVNDFAGHAFPVHLSRWLAQAGHVVHHAYCPNIEAPRGALRPRSDDSPNLTIHAVDIGRPLNKYKFLQRAIDEFAYCRQLEPVMKAAKPDVVISGNASPLVQVFLSRGAHRAGAAFVYWLQDIFSVALDHAMQGRSRWLSAPLRLLLRRIEFGTLARSDGIVLISEDFKALLTAQGVSLERAAVIENWAPAEEVTWRPKSNAWSMAAGLAEKFVFLYSGTLGLKHNPSLLSALARSFEGDPAVRVVVISNGLGREWLEREKAERNLDNLLLFDYVSFETLPDCLGAADVQVVILEPHAGILSVPSKVLTYIAAEKPILGAIPTANLAAGTISKNGLGRNVEPFDEAGFLAAAHAMRHEAEIDGRLGALRSYKAENFDIVRIGGKFIDVFERAIAAGKDR